MDSVFPEGLKRLRDADEEVFGIIEDEKVRQWCVLNVSAGLSVFAGPDSRWFPEVCFVH